MRLPTVLESRKDWVEWHFTPMPFQWKGSSYAERELFVFENFKYEEPSNYPCFAYSESRSDPYGDGPFVTYSEHIYLSKQDIVDEIAELNNKRKELVKILNKMK